jgi:hypothetical protein
VGNEVGIMGWWFIVIFVVTIVSAIMLAPKPPKDRGPATLADFDIPTAEDGRPMPIIFGTVLFKSPNNIWYGDLATHKITE